jgi:hypothetical protein
VEIFGEITKRLEAIERENAELRAKVAALEGRDGRKSIPAPPEPAVKISTPAPAPVAEDLFPSGKELQLLRDICARELPAFCNSDGYVAGRRGTISKEENDFEFLLQFQRSILGISCLKMLPKPATKYTVSYFVEAARTELRARGKATNELRTAPFAAMCLGRRRNSELFHFARSERVRRKRYRPRGMALS